VDASAALHLKRKWFEEILRRKQLAKRLSSAHFRAVDSDQPITGFQLSTICRAPGRNSSDHHALVTAPCRRHLSLLLSPLDSKAEAELAGHTLGHHLGRHLPDTGRHDLPSSLSEDGQSELIADLSRADLPLKRTDFHDRLSLNRHDQITVAKPGPRCGCAAQDFNDDHAVTFSEAVAD
jgi:hypothetical protein